MNFTPISQPFKFVILQYLRYTPSMQREIDFIPYQYRPVLKFIKADLPRLLIADSVGVGKND